MLVGAAVAGSAPLWWPHFTTLYATLSARMRVRGLVRPMERMSTDSLTAFLNSLATDELVVIKHSLNLPDDEALDINLLKWRISDLSGHKVINWGRKIVAQFSGEPPAIDYHEKLVWAGNGFEVDTDSDCSFLVERRVCEGVFAKTWDGLTIEQREEYLEKASIGRTGAERAAMVSMDGASAVIDLTGEAVRRAGFQFYTRMSQFIAAAGRLVGTTLPFTVYTTASTVVAFLAGPWGLAISGVITVIQYGVFGFPKAKNLAPFIVAVHSLKASRLEEVDSLNAVNRKLGIS